MNRSGKTEAQRVDDVARLRARVAELEQAEARHERVDDLTTGGDAQTRAILDGIKTNIAFIDENMEVQWANVAAAESVGLSPEALVGRRCHELWADPGRPCEGCPVVRAFRTGKTERDIIHSPDGRIWDERGEPVLDSEGKLIGVVDIAHNITEEVRTGEALREANEKLDATLNALPDLLFEVDRSGHYCDYHSFSPDQLYVPPEEFIGKTIGEILPDDAAAVLMHAIAEAAETGRHLGATYSLDISGDTRWFELSIAAKGDATAPEGRLILLVRDVTDRKQAQEALQRAHDELEARVAQWTAELRSVNLRLEQEVAERKRSEEALRASEANYRAIYDAANDAIFVHDLVTGDILDVNEKFCEMFGHSREEARQLSVEAVSAGWPPYTEADALRWLRKVAQRGPQVLEWMAKDAAGRLFWVEITLKRATLGGKDRVLAVVRDISERKQAEDASRVFTRSMEQSRDGIIITGADSEITFANQAVGEMLGVDVSEMIHREPEEVLGLDERTQEEIQVSLADQGNWSGLVETHREGAEPVTIELTYVSIADEREVPIATVSVLRDARQARRLASLQQMAEDLARTDVADEASLRRVMDHLPELVGLDAWAIYVHDHEGHTLVLRACSETARPITEAAPVVPVEDSLNGQVLRRGEILVSADALSDHRFLNNPRFRPAQNAATRANVRAICILPIRSGSGALGTLNVADHRVRTFTPEELNVLKTLASQIALLLDRERRGQPGRPARLQPDPGSSVSVVAESGVMKQVLHMAEQIALTDLSVILLGATGVGKGHLAKYIHARSPRASGPFLAVNCACLEGELILSELFGHERGAFTGAVRRQRGCFELANGGTLLLDEVVELPHSAQAKLLQVVETQQFRRLGGQRTTATDVRIICTTNADIRECVRSGKLRQDLYYRLNTAEIYIPPLRDRPEDVGSLALSHLRMQALASGKPACRLTDGALARLREYHWPGNVRELQNVLTQASAYDGRVIAAKDLRFSPAVNGMAELQPESAQRGEREAVLDALRQHRWNRSLAAKQLGIHRNTLRERMRKYGITQ